MVDSPPLCLRHARRVLISFVTKRRKVVSTISTVLVTVGGIVSLPGVSEIIGGAMFTPYVVRAAGAIAVAVGKWLKAAVDSAAANQSPQGDQAQPIGHVATDRETVTSSSLTHPLLRESFRA